MKNDITYCTSNTCPLKHECGRNRENAPNWESWYSCSEFQYDYEEEACEHYLQPRKPYLPSKRVKKK